MTLEIQEYRPFATTRKRSERVSGLGRGIYDLDQPAVASYSRLRTVLLVECAMLSCDEILDAWSRHKKSGRFYRLSAPIEVVHEYQGPQPGHPSSYASVVIKARTASDLGLELTAELPASVTPEKRRCLYKKSMPFPRNSEEKASSSSS
jgi:hypothetical protein